MTGLDRPARSRFPLMPAVEIAEGDELPEGRKAWLHVVAGTVAIGDVVMVVGDGVGVTQVPSLSFTAKEPSEILLVDLDDVDSGSSLPRGER